MSYLSTILTKLNIWKVFKIFVTVCKTALIVCMHNILGTRGFASCDVLKVGKLITYLGRNVQLLTK